MAASDPAPDFVGQWWQAVQRTFGALGAAMHSMTGAPMQGGVWPFAIPGLSRSGEESTTAAPSTAAMNAPQIMLQMLVASYGALGGRADGLSTISPLDERAGPEANPYVAGLERTFGAVVDALGMGPSRAMADAWRELARADQQKRQAGAQYLAVVAGAWNQVPTGVIAELELLRQRGERIDSFVAWVRLWSRVAEAKMHDAMQSPAGLQATAAYVRAGARHRQQQNRVVALVSEYYGIPTRSELDDAYFEIQQLKRDVRALQRANRASPRPAESTIAPRPMAVARRKRRESKRAGK